MIDADKHVATRPDAPAVPAQKDTVPPHLRSSRRTLLWSLRAVCIGFLLGLATLLAGLIGMDAGISDVFGWFLIGLAITSGLLVFLGLLGTAAAGMVWFSTVYFGYTRYSLRTLLIAVWIFAGILALLVAESDQLRAFGIPLLIVFVIVLVARIAANDPLASPGLRELITPEEKTKPPGNGKTD